ncbi:unnamed protein product [Pleuronectes platessa]|uniref:Uncharacterized protein n=1 Tax=Pleuronectes platessa TaxID=8262 RepID=A0A9N7UHH9_PLEPL|nr:unnamed protein product [Pleuronectes platessa]
MSELLTPSSHWTPLRAEPDEWDFSRCNLARSIHKLKKTPCHPFPPPRLPASYGCQSGEGVACSSFSIPLWAHQYGLQSLHGAAYLQSRRVSARPAARSAHAPNTRLLMLPKPRVALNVPPHGRTQLRNMLLDSSAGTFLTLRVISVYLLRRIPVTLTCHHHHHHHCHRSLPALHRREKNDSLIKPYSRNDLRDGHGTIKAGGASPGRQGDRWGHEAEQHPASMHLAFLADLKEK